MVLDGNGWDGVDMLKNVKNFLDKNREMSIIFYRLLRRLRAPRNDEGERKATISGTVSS